ncbi:hypothetical protein CR513_22019, partial [Mucuna pruriens]
MRTYEEIPTNKVVDKILRVMLMNFDHVVTTIIKSHDTDTMTITYCKEVLKVMKINKEALKSQVNLNNDVKSSQSVEEGEEIIQVEVKEGNYRGRGLAISTKEETTTSYHIMKEEMETILVLPIKEEDTITTTRKKCKHKTNIVENRYQNISENFDNPQSLFLIHHGYYALIDRNRRFIAKVKMTPNHLFSLKIHHENFSCLNSYVSSLAIINIPNGVCLTCKIGKKYRESFSTKKFWREKKILELFIHINIPIYGGNEYFITFVDNLSKKSWVYFLKQKSEACNVFKTFKTFVEKQIECKIKALRTDRGQEYLAWTFF